MPSSRDYSSVTESPGNQVTHEAVDMVLTRYHWAAGLSAGKDVLEVGCGAGQGLGYVARSARRVIGGDYTDALVRAARRQYEGRLPLLRLDAQALPFAAGSFDIVLLFEAIYYLPDAVRFVAECARVLRDGGRLLICSANCETGAFNPSPFSTRYLTARELQRMLEDAGFRTELFGAFPAGSRSLAGRAVGLVKRIAVACHLVPKTMKGKETLKRIFLGPLKPFPAELDGHEGTPHALTALTESPDREFAAFKVLYAQGIRRT
jgi:SAM-dependent methyltransferase